MIYIFYYLKNLVYIVEGYCKWLYDKVSGKESERAKKRLEICNSCEHNKHGICSLCGCILKAKVRVDFLTDENGISIDGCPKLKW